MQGKMESSRRNAMFSPFNPRRKVRKLEDILKETEYQVRDEDSTVPIKAVVDAFESNANLEDQPRPLEVERDEQQAQPQQEEKLVKKRLRRLSDIQSSRLQKRSKHTTQDVSLALGEPSHEKVFDEYVDRNASSPQQKSFSDNIPEGGVIQEISSSQPRKETGKRRRLRRLSDIDSSKHGRESDMAVKLQLDFQSNPLPEQATDPPFHPKKGWKIGSLYSRYVAEQKALEQSHSDHEESDTRSIDCDAEINEVLRSLNSKGKIGVVVGKHNGKIYGGIVRKSFTDNRVIPPPSPRTEARVQEFLRTTLEAEYQQIARRAHFINEYKRLLLRALKRGRWRVSKYVRTTAKSAIRQEEVMNFINKQKRIKHRGSSDFSVRK